MQKISVYKLGQISKAEIEFGDLTIFVGAQASGKSILLQLIKLVLDHNHIVRTNRKHGFDWQRSPENFISLYFGEGMQGIWSEETQIQADGIKLDLKKFLDQRGKKTQEEKMFLIPAHRVVTLKNGWPRAFTDYEIGDPYMVKQFSESLRLLMEKGLGSGKGAIFPQEGRMNKEFRNAINDTLFANAEVRLDKSGMRKRVVLQVQGNIILPYMVWSTGQREFIPLLLGLYWLMPSSGATKSKNFEWVVVEEPEMGLHPQAVSALLNIVLELLHRGYKVILSTHSSQVLELVWAVRILKNQAASPDQLLDLLRLRKSKYLTEFAQDVLNKTYRAYYFERQNDKSISIKDISTLDPIDIDDAIADWGGLTSFSTHISRIVSQVVQKADNHISTK